MSDAFAAPSWRARSLAPAELCEVIAAFLRDGFALIPSLLHTEDAALLAERASEIMDGQRAPNDWFFQHDSPTGRYDDLTYGRGFVGPSQAYRKIEKLERDPWFRAWLEHPALEPIVRSVVFGAIALCRAVLWNKAPFGGTELPWHQDGGRFWGLSEQPVLQLWTALDDAPVESGCVELVAGSHRGGLATPKGGTIPAERCRDLSALHVPARRGDVLLLHNLCWHRSGRNATASARRALSGCYMSARVRCTRKQHPRQFPRLFGLR